MLVAGAIFDVTGTYVVPFAVAGAEFVVSGLVTYSMTRLTNYFKHVTV